MGYTGTKNCVRCFKPAETWCGYVLKKGQKITAGWCKDCFNGAIENKEGNGAVGFMGHHLKRMGLKNE